MECYRRRQTSATVLVCPHTLYVGGPVIIKPLWTSVPSLLLFTNKPHILATEFIIKSTHLARYTNGCNTNTNDYWTTKSPIHLQQVRVLCVSDAPPQQTSYVTLPDHHYKQSQKNAYDTVSLTHTHVVNNKHTVKAHHLKRNLVHERTWLQEQLVTTLYSSFSRFLSYLWKPQQIPQAVIFTVWTDSLPDDKQCQRTRHWL